jgi:anti-sigma B factor antagonist
MICKRTDNGPESHLQIEGALDALTAVEIRPILDQLVTDRRLSVTVDIAQMTMIDSSGVGALVSLFKRTKIAGGTMRIVGARDQPLQVLKLLKLDRAFGM